MEYYAGLFLLFLAVYFAALPMFVTPRDAIAKVVFKVLPIILMMVSLFFALSHLGFIVQFPV